MSNTSMMVSGFPKNALPFTVGVAVGVLGHYAVKWLKEYISPTRTHGIIHVVALTEKGPVIKEVSLPEFKKLVPNEELNALRKSVDWAARSDKIWRQVVQTSSHIVCVKKNNQLVGFGCFVGNGRMGTIFDIHVHPEHQKQKIGTLIMNTLIKEIKNQEYASVGLFGWEENKTVLSFYEKFGFKPNTYGMQSSSEKLTLYNKA